MKLVRVSCRIYVREQQIQITALLWRQSKNDGLSVSLTHEIQDVRPAKFSRFLELQGTRFFVHMFFGCIGANELSANFVLKFVRRRSEIFAAASGDLELHSAGILPHCYH